jgi:hypothetical protein
VRGLGNVVSYALFSILCLVLNREAAEKVGRTDKEFHQPISKLNIGTKQRAKIGKETKRSKRETSFLGWIDR